MIDIQTLLIYAIPVLFAITVHETAHGWVASLLGDHSARMMGRLTLNPIKHIDLIGTLVVPAFFAGPMSNFIMAIIWLVTIFVAINTGSQFLADMAQIGIQINLLLAVLNLLPLPPLDGGRVVSALLPPKISYQFDQLEAYGLFILLGLLFLGIFQSVILPIVKFIQQWLYTLVGLI